MIVLHLKPAGSLNPTTDPLGRHEFGYRSTMTPAQLYQAGRGCWVFGAQAKRQRIALFEADGIIRGALEISGFQNCGGRTALIGTMLKSGDPVFDHFVGKPSPVSPARNPVRYLADPVYDQRLCGCGCKQASVRDFIPGHDQKAVHDRISRHFGSVKAFLDWFDRQVPSIQSIG